MKLIININLIIAILFSVAKLILILFISRVSFEFFIMSQIVIIWSSLFMALVTILLTIKKPCIQNFVAFTLYIWNGVVPIIQAYFLFGF